MVVNKVLFEFFEFYASKQFLFFTRYHQAVIPSHSALVFFEVEPEQGKSLEVYVNYKTRPTVEQYVFSAITPNIDYCNETKSGLNCSSEAYVIVVSSAVTGHVGLHYIGIRYPGPEDDNSSSSGQTAQQEARRVKRGCEIHGGRQKRACVGVKDPPTTPPPTPKIIIPRYEASTDVNYTISATVTNCLYWSETRQVWTDDGCMVCILCSITVSFVHGNFVDGLRFSLWTYERGSGENASTINGPLPMIIFFQSKFSRWS